MSDILDSARHNPWGGGASFSIRHRFIRALWNLCWKLLAAWTPPPMHGWRRQLLRLFGAKLAPTSVVYASARIWYPPNLELGEFACIGPRVNVYCMAPIRFGNHALASQGAHLCAGTHDIEDIHFQLKARPITIGSRAWIAAEAFVGPGVQVGEGAVLGARSVAFRDLEPWMVHVGNPATALRPRRVRFPADRP